MTQLTYKDLPMGAQFTVPGSDLQFVKLLQVTPAHSPETPVELLPGQDGSSPEAAL